MRTFQRRVRQWLLEHGKEVYFTRRAVLAVDWTDKPVVNAAEVTALLRTYEDEAIAFRERKAIPLSLHVYDGLLGGGL